MVAALDTAGVGSQNRASRVLATEEMMEVTSYAPGTPSWADVSAPDVDAAVAFYGALFGWEAQDIGPEAGGYRMFTLRGKYVAGLGPLMGEGVPPHWTTYVSVADAADVTAAARGGGATVFVEPMDVFDAGRMAVMADPLGAYVAIWQPGVHIGAQLANEPGTLCWAELACRDVEAAKQFYSPLFDWEPKDQEIPGVTYVEWHLGGRPVGGMVKMDDNWPAEAPPHWMVYISVADSDATCAQVTELGGNVAVPPTDIRPGRFAVVSDPGGAYFSVITFTPEFMAAE